MSQNQENTRTLTLCAMLAAMAYAAMLLTRPLPQVAGFLSYDLKDVVVAIGGFLLGPLPALGITAVVSLIEMVTVSHTGPIGLLMNLLSTSAFVLPSAILYRRNRTLKSALIGLVAGVALMAAVMVAWNYIVTPLYMGVPRDVVAGMLLTTFLPFNLVKGGLNAGITMLLYKPLSRALRRFMPQTNAQQQAHRVNVPVLLIGLALAGTCAALFYIMT